MPRPPVPTAILSVKARIDAAARRGWRWMGGYARVKVERDPIYAQLLERIPATARVLDLGAGIGLLGLVLHARDHAQIVQGLEWDERKVAFARALVPPDSRIQVQQGDILTSDWPPADVVALIDVLHYFGEAEQRRLIQKLAAHLGPDGILFVRVMNPDVQGRAWLTRLLEKAAVAVGWNRAARVHWRGIGAIMHDLEACGLRAAVCPAPARLLEGNRLIMASKGAPEAFLR